MFTMGHSNLWHQLFVLTVAEPPKAKEMAWGISKNGKEDPMPPPLCIPQHFSTPPHLVSANIKRSLFSCQPGDQPSVSINNFMDQRGLNWRATATASRDSIRHAFLSAGMEEEKTDQTKGLIKAISWGIKLVRCHYHWNSERSGFWKWGPSLSKLQSLLLLTYSYQNWLTQVEHIPLLQYRPVIH